MGIHQSILLLLLSVAYLLTCNDSREVNISRNDFPHGFIFGTAISAYQYEGATNVDGKKPSIWDTFTEKHPEKIKGRSSGKVADDFYYQYEADIVDRLKPIGFDSFRFSIAWSRVLPNGTLGGGVNTPGVEFYKKLIQTLLDNDIEPIVTLFHWDLPQALEDKYCGFLCLDFVDDYLEYVNFCFNTFGDKVKKWITFNEPYIFTSGGYEFGIRAPGRCSHYAGNCDAGNSATEPYLVMHHLLLAHAKAVHLYRKHYKAEQKGIIGLTLQVTWIVPKFQTLECCQAAYRALDFMAGWILHPITFGDYPETMKSSLGCRLPKFNEDESKLLKESIDFLGVNYYTARYAEPLNVSICVLNESPSSAVCVNLTTSRYNVSIGKQIGDTWMYVYPKGIEEVVMYIKENYNNPPMYITENGVNDPPYSGIRDSVRIDFYRKHLWHLLKAINLGANVKGYYTWTFLDDFEWESGYTMKFGFYRVNRITMERTPKASACWFKEFLNPPPGIITYKEQASPLLSTAYEGDRQINSA